MAKFWSKCRICGKKMTAQGKPLNGDPTTIAMNKHIAITHGWELLSKDDQHDVVDALWQSDYRKAQLTRDLYASAGQFLKCWNLNKDLSDVIDDANDADPLFQKYGGAV